VADYELHLTPEGAAALKAIEDLDGVTIKVGWANGMKTASAAQSAAAVRKSRLFILTAVRSPPSASIP